MEYKLFKYESTSDIVLYIISEIDSFSILSSSNTFSFFSIINKLENKILIDKNISVVWINADELKGETMCEDKHIFGNRLTFSWDIPGTCTNTAGTIKFAIRIVGENYAWHTLPFTIECVQGLIDGNWEDTPDAEQGISWADWLESQYRATVKILSEQQYNAIVNKEEVLYVVKMSGNFVNLYLGTTYIDTLRWGQIPTNN